MERTSKIEVRAGESLSGAIARTQAENEPANLRKQVNDIQQALGTAQELSAAWAEKARQYELELEGDPQNLHGKGRTFGLRSQLATLQAQLAACQVENSRLIGMAAQQALADTGVKNQDLIRIACTWQFDDDDTDMAETECGHAFTFEDPDRAADWMKFCCYCGKPVELLRPEDIDEVNK